MKVDSYKLEFLRSLWVVVAAFSLLSCSSTNTNSSVNAQITSASSPTIALPQCAVEADSPTFQAYCLFNSAVLLQAEGYFDRAKEEYLQVISLDDQWVEAYTRLGDLYFRASDFDKAEEMYLASIQLDDSNPLPFHNLGVIYDINDRQEEAIASFTEAIRLNPRSAQARYNLGLVYSRSPDNLDEAVSEFLRAIELDPNFAIVHYDLGRIYEYLDQPKVSADHYMKARELGYTEAAEKGR